MADVGKNTAVTSERKHFSEIPQLNLGSLAKKKVGMFILLHKRLMQTVDWYRQTTVIYPSCACTVYSVAVLVDLR